MDYLLPISSAGIEEEQQAFADAVRRWANHELIARRHDLREDYDQLLRPALRRLLLQLGLQAHLWPEGAGGDGKTPAGAAMTLALALEQVGRGDVGLGVVVACQLATAAAVRGADPDRSAAMAPLFCNREREVLVAPVLPLLDLSPGPAGPTLGGRRLQATARADGEAWVVDGQDTRPAVCGQDASHYAVLCQLEERGEHGVLLVPADATGVRRGRVIRQTGLAAARNALVSFRGVRAPRSNLILEGEESWRALRSWLALGLAATCSGALLAGLEILVDWAETRVIKGRGQRFVDNSLVVELMARLVQRSTLVRACVRDLARLLAGAEPGAEPVLLSALTVAHDAGAAAEEGLGRAMELMGSAGYATEWNLERYWRDARSVGSLLGSAVLDRLELARHCFGHGRGC